MRERMRTPDTNSIAVARAQQVDDEWDTMVAVFDRVMATTDPHQLKAARAAWARGEIDLTSPDQEALTPHGGAELAGALAAEGQAATGDTLAPPEMNMLQEQPKIDLTSPDQEALMPHDGAELAGALAAEGQAATGDMPAPPGNMRDGWSTDVVECYSDLTIKRWPTAQWVATGDRPGDHTITSLRYKTGREGLSVRLSLPDAYNTDGWVTPEDLYDMICESYGCLSTAGHPNDPVLNHWDDSWSSGIDEPGWYGVWSEREAIAFLGAVVQHNAVVLIQAVARRREVQRRRKEQTAAMPEHASTSNSSGPAPPPHTPTKGSSSRPASEPGSPAVSPPRPPAPVGSEPESSSSGAARHSSGPVPRTPTRNSRSSSGVGPPAPAQPESDADFHAALAALEDAPSSSICWSQPPHSAPEAALDDFGLAMATFRTLAAELMHISAGPADTGETNDVAQLLREASPAGGFWGAATDTQEAEQQPLAQQPGAGIQPGVEQQPGTERQLEQQVEHQLGAQPRGRLWPTGESDTEEEDETSEWPAGRTAATFERHKRFADLDAGAPRRQALQTTSGYRRWPDDSVHTRCCQ